MNEILKIGEILPPDTLAGLSTDDLRQALGEAIGATIAAIKRAAMIWAELERRGEDMSQFRFALSAYMRPIANGKLLPEVVARLAGQPRTLDAISALPVETQRALIEGAKIDVVAGDGIVQKKTLAEMTWPEVARVIKDGAIRNAKEQEFALNRALAIGAARHKRGGRPVRLIVSTQTGEVHIGQQSVSIQKLLDALRAAGVLSQ